MLFVVIWVVRCRSEIERSAKASSNTGISIALLDILCERTNESTMRMGDNEECYSKQAQRISPDEGSPALKSLAIAILLELFD